MQTWLASRLGVRADVLNRWVQGVHEPSDEIKARIASELGQEVAVLFPPERAAEAA